MSKQGAMPVTGSVKKKSALKVWLIMATTVALLFNPVPTFAIARELAQKRRTLKFILSSHGSDRAWNLQPSLLLPIFFSEDKLFGFTLKGTYQRYRENHIYGNLYEENIGLFLRQRWNSDWIIGQAIFIDHQKSLKKKDFYQAVFHLDFLSDIWKIHTNFYQPFQKKRLLSTILEKGDKSRTRITSTYEYSPPRIDVSVSLPFFRVDNLRLGGLLATSLAGSGMECDKVGYDNLFWSTRWERSIGISL